MLKRCHLCGRAIEADQRCNDPAVLAGCLLSEQEYGDVGELCSNCLASRGQLAMMYRPDCFD